MLPIQTSFVPLNMQIIRKKYDINIYERLNENDFTTNYRKRYKSSLSKNIPQLNQQKQ